MGPPKPPVALPGGFKLTLEQCIPCPPFHTSWAARTCVVSTTDKVLAVEARATRVIRSTVDVSQESERSSLPY